MYASVDELEQCVNKEIASKKFDAALFAVQAFVEQVIYHPHSLGNVIASKSLDSICQKIGAAIDQKLLIENPIVPLQENLVVYVASRLYRSGGHTAVIADLIQYQPEKNHIILITDIFQNSQINELQERFSAPNIRFEIAPDQSLTKKVIWLQQRLQHFMPEKIFLFNHHQDSVAIAAMQAAIKSPIYFFHHADHNLCLGIYLPQAIHIDAQSLGFNYCCQKLGIQNNVYWPLVVPDLGKRTTGSSFMQSGKLITCSSGSPAKFETPYLFPYANLVADILGVTGGRHIHIGKLSAPILKRITKHLSQQGIASDRFIYIPWVKSLWQTVIDHQVDLYFNSFPISGGRAVIEIMGSGTPVIMHENYRSEYLGQVYLAYAEAFFWRKPSELLNFLPTVTPTWLQQQSDLARVHYEKYFSPSLLTKAMRSKEGLQPPALPSYQADVLQLFLENHKNFTLKNWLKNKMMSCLWQNRNLVNFFRGIRKKILRIN